MSEDSLHCTVHVSEGKVEELRRKMVQGGWKGKLQKRQADVKMHVWTKHTFPVSVSKPKTTTTAKLKLKTLNDLTFHKSHEWYDPDALFDVVDSWQHISLHCGGPAGEQCPTWLSTAKRRKARGMVVDGRYYPRGSHRELLPSQVSLIVPHRWSESTRQSGAFLTSTRGNGGVGEGLEQRRSGRRSWATEEWEKVLSNGGVGDGLEQRRSGKQTLCKPVSGVRDKSRGLIAVSLSCTRKSPTEPLTPTASPVKLFKLSLWSPTPSPLSL